MYVMINGAKAKTLVSKGAKLIDVRSPIEFMTNTLPGAVNVPFRNVSTLVSRYTKKDVLICFGNEGQNDATQFASYAVQLGFSKVYVLRSIGNWYEE